MSLQFTLDDFLRKEIEAVALADATTECEKVHKYAPPKIIAACTAAALKAVFESLQGSRVYFPSQGGNGKTSAIDEKLEWEIYKLLGTELSLGAIANKTGASKATVFRLRKKILGDLYPSVTPQQSLLKP